LKTIGVGALMIQSYVVTEEENGRLNSSREVFDLFVQLLDATIRGEAWRDGVFSVLEVIEVTTDSIYRVVQKNGATLHFPKYLENY